MDVQKIAEQCPGIGTISCCFKSWATDRKEYKMASMKTMGMAVLAALTIAGSIVATTTDAEARYRGGGGFRGGYGGGYGGGYRGYGGGYRGYYGRYRGGYYGGYRGYGIGAGIATGLAIGAIGAGYGYGPGYGYYDGCVQNRVVGYTYYGHPIVRPVNVCY
jgi:hypothetical protein